MPRHACAAILMVFPALMWAQTLTVNDGTVVALRKDQHRFIVVAGNTVGDKNAGRPEHAGCNIIALDEKHFFLSTGKSQLLDQGQIIFDANEAAKKVFDDLGAGPNSAHHVRQVSFYLGTFLKALFYDMLIQLPHVVNATEPKTNLLTAIIGGTTDSGELVSFVVSIDAEQIPDSRVPLVGFNVARFDPGPLTALGAEEKNGIMEFLQDRTERAKAGNIRMEEQIARSTTPDREVIRMRTAVQSAIDWAQQQSSGSSPLDIVELRRGQTIHWIQRNPNCH